MGQKDSSDWFSACKVTRDWASRWYANSKNFAGMLNEDVQVRAYLNQLKHASVGALF